MQSVICENKEVIAGIAKLDGIEFSDKIPAGSIEKTMDGYKLIIPLEGLIDPKEEMIRLQKELTDVENDIQIISSKLANEQFISKAPLQLWKKKSKSLRC